MPNLFLSNLAQELESSNGMCDVLNVSANTNLALFDITRPTSTISFKTIEPLIISQQSLDRVLVDRMSIDPNEPENAAILTRGQLNLPLFEYLLDCWKRLEHVKLQTSKANVSLVRCGKVWPFQELASYLSLIHCYTRFEATGKCHRRASAVTERVQKAACIVRRLGSPNARDVSSDSQVRKDF